MSKFGANRLNYGEVKYGAYVVFTKSGVFIKAANKVWYHVTTTHTRVVPENTIEFKAAVFTVYETFTKNENSLVRAQPIPEIANLDTKPKLFSEK